MMDDQATLMQEVRILCHGLLEDALDESQLLRLDHLVTGNAEARLAYIELINLHNTLMRHRSSAVLRDSTHELTEETGTEEEASDFDEALSLDTLSPLLQCEPPMVSTPDVLPPLNSESAVNTTVIDIITQALPTTVKNVVSSSAFLSGTITFSVGMFAFFVYMLIPSSVQMPSDFARVSQTLGAVWVNGTGDGDLQKLCIGRQLELESGLAQVEYTNGIRVNLEGPALFVVSGPNQGVLVRGKVSALVKEVPTGFTIQTPVGKVIDLGTEFGIKIDEDKDTEVQVFDGRVKLDIAGARQGTGTAVTAPQQLDLRETESVRVDSDLRVVEPTPYMPDQFSRTYKKLKPYYFDGFSADTSQRYVGTHSVWSEEKSIHSVGKGSLVAEVDFGTYSVFSRERLFGPDEIFAVDVPATKPGLDVFLIVSTAVGEPQGGRDGGLGFRLRREHGKGLVVQQNESTQVSYGEGGPFLIGSSRVADPAPGRSLRLVIRRRGEAEFTFYHELDGVRTKIFGPLVHSELAGAERLYVGVEASNRSTQKQTVAFDDFSVRPISDKDSETSE